jgi:hypothetical protein
VDIGGEGRVDIGGEGLVPSSSSTRSSKYIGGRYTEDFPSLSRVSSSPRSSSSRRYRDTVFVETPRFLAIFALPTNV